MCPPECHQCPTCFKSPRPRPPSHPPPLFGVVPDVPEATPPAPPPDPHETSFDLVLCGLGWLARNDNARPHPARPLSGVEHLHLTRPHQRHRPNRDKHRDQEAAPSHRPVCGEARPSPAAVMHQDLHKRIAEEGGRSVSDGTESGKNVRRARKSVECGGHRSTRARTCFMHTRRGICWLHE